MLGHSLNELAVLLQVVWVPGSFEIPVVAQELAKSGNFNAVLCIGVVVSLLYISCWKVYFSIATLILHLIAAPRLEVLPPTMTQWLEQLLVGSSMLVSTLECPASLGCLPQRTKSRQVELFNLL